MYFLRVRTISRQYAQLLCEEVLMLNGVYMFVLLLCVNMNLLISQIF